MSGEIDSLNVCVMVGTIHRDPEWRSLPSGTGVTAFDLKVRDTGGAAEILRVSWLDAPASALDLREGTEVLVCGSLRSYWAKRRVMDVKCVSVVPLRTRSKVRRNISAALATLQSACP